MPYVEVWVDDAACDGQCGAGKEVDRLEAMIAEAERLLRAGYYDAALHALTNDAAIPVKDPSQIAKSYEAWKKGRLPGFANYKAAPTERVDA